MIAIAGAANQNYLRSPGAEVTMYGAGWIDRVKRLGHVDASLDLAGSRVIQEVVDLTGDVAKVVSIADLGAPAFVRFSDVGASMPEALAEAADLISRKKLHIAVEKAYPLAEAAAAQIDRQAGDTRGRWVVVI